MQPPETNTLPPVAPTPKRSVLGVVYEYVETFAYALSMMILMFVFIFRVVSVDGESMRNTLQDEDRLIISHINYTPETGDIVVLKHSPDPLIKRIIATSGQYVEIDFENWRVTVDGVELDEDYVRRMPGTMGYDQNYHGGFYVEEGKVFVLGDNRTNSRDSREFGFFDESDILGRVVWRLFPFSVFGPVK